MPCKRLPYAVLVLSLLQILHFGAVAQSQSRSRLKDDISVLRKELREKEKQLLEPSAEDRAAFAEFLKQPDTGLIRLFPGKESERLLTVSGGGSYYSFTKLTHEYGLGSDIELKSTKHPNEFESEYQARWRHLHSPDFVISHGDEIEELTFHTGFAGSDYGFLVNLGNVPLDQVTLDRKGVRFLAGYATPSTGTERRAENLRARSGISMDGFIYISTLPVVPNNTYVLRSINFNRSDVLIAFHVVRIETDASLVLLWKRLKRFSTPKY